MRRNNPPESNTTSAFNTATPPSVSPQPEASLEYERVAQMARNDAATSVDTLALQVLGGSRLPSVGEIIARGRAQVADVALRISIARVLQAPAEHTIRFEEGENYDELAATVSDLDAVIANTDAERSEEIAFLHGEADKTGARFSGSVPARPTEASRGSNRARRLTSPNVTRWLIDVGIGFIAAPAEFLIILTNFMLITDNDLLVSFGGAVAGTFMAVFVPKAVGHALAGVVRGAHISWAKGTLLFVLTTAWIAGSAALASARVSAIELKEKQDLALSTAKSVSEIHLTNFDSSSQFWTWLLFIVALGIALIASTTAWYNPHISQVMRLDTALFTLKRQRAAIAGRVAGINSKVTAAAETAELVLEAHGVYGESIPDLVAALSAAYTAELLRSLADPAAVPLLAEDPKRDATRPSPRLFAVRDSSEETTADIDTKEAL